MGTLKGLQVCSAIGTFNALAIARPVESAKTKAKQRKANVNG
jgi:hypothetical protein